MEVAKSYNEELQAQEDIWKYVSGLTEMAAVKCAVDLAIPDILENHGRSGSMTLTELSAVLGCSLSPLYRIMRLLTHHGIFKEVKTDKQDSPFAYVQTPLSRLLVKNGMAPLVQFICSPVTSASLMGLGNFLTAENDEYSSAFQAAHGLGIWEYVAANPSYRNLFNRAMACKARSIISTVIENYQTVFEGIGCLVDVGGGDGATLRALVKAYPRLIRAVNFDLPHMVTKSSSSGDDRVEHVGGDMFVAVPNADAILIMSVLQDWDDQACVKILKNCKEAIPRETGKVIIVDVVVDDENPNTCNNKYRGVHLTFDIEILAHTGKGRQRTAKEWANVLNAAGFANHTVKHIPAPKSVIEAYP